MYRSSPFRSTLNTEYITAVDMCEVCTEAVHSVAPWTRVTSQLWTSVKYEPPSDTFVHISTTFTRFYVSRTILRLHFRGAWFGNSTTLPRLYLWHPANSTTLTRAPNQPGAINKMWKESGWWTKVCQNLKLKMQMSCNNMYHLLITKQGVKWSFPPFLRMMLLKLTNSLVKAVLLSLWSKSNFSLIHNLFRRLSLNFGLPFGLGMMNIIWNHLQRGKIFLTCWTSVHLYVKMTWVINTVLRSGNMPLLPQKQKPHEEFVVSRNLSLKVMHDKGIQAIIDICDSLYHCGLPAWFMIAKVILLPKFATATCIPDMRPITIFSLIFRTWAKVTARRLLNKWSLTIPSCVVGALPKRSCTQLSLKNAVRIERELSIGAGDVGGFYLDICKCFNAFGRLPVILAMRKCGFPESMACFWKSSLNQMSRTLMALGSFSCPEKATTGLPERDPLSVCGMAVIGFCWSHLLKCINVIVSVYADDWSWMGTHPRQHILAIRLTQDFLQSLKLHADPSKIWVWGSSPEARKQWSKISLEITGNPRSYRVATAEKELGIYLHYTKQNGLGCQLDRLEEGVKRLRKLRTLPVSIQKKASLIQTNVWPCALFGTDATYLGQKRFARLRSLLTEAIVPKTKYTNCYLASCVMSDSLMDPLVYVIVRTLKLWRRMLLTVTDIEDNDMLRHILSEAVADPQRAFGPATTLCSYLEKINWSISPQGKCVDQNGFIFDLVEVSNTYITNRVRDAWNFVVAQSIETRSDFENWPVPMCQFTFDDRNFIDSRTAAIVAIHQTMGQEFGDKTRSWVGGTKQETYTCPLCDGCDNQQHFLLECSHLQTLRDENWRLLKRFKDDFPHMLFLPILYQRPQQSLATAICDHRLLPDLFAMDFNGVDISEGRTFFTDGSCIFPHLPCARMAGFSVVVDLAESHQDRINAVHMVSEGSPPSLLQPVCAGLQCGEQTINRAELSALIQVTLSVHAATIFTDSSYACNVYKEVQEQPHPMYHHMKENFDLLIILCRCFLEGKNPNNFSVKKILAHQNVDEVTDPLQRYQVFGNMLADKMAKSVLKEDRSDFHRLMWKLGRFNSRQKQLLRQLLKVVTHVDILRQDAFDKRKTTELRRQLAYAPDLAQWRVSDGLRVFPTTISDEVLSAFIPGASVLISILQWASQLRWPTEATDACLGISHFELTTNCLLYTKKPFPFVLTKRGK